MRRFSEEEVALFDEVSQQSVRRARIVYSRVMPPGAAGVTFGALIVIRRGITPTERPDLYLHELIHVEQYHRLGAHRFLLRYLRDYVANLWDMRSHRTAYLAVPFEREARERVNRWSKRRRAS